MCFSRALWNTPRESGWTVGIAVRNAFSTALSVAEEAGMRLVTDVRRQVCFLLQGTVRRGIWGLGKSCSEKEQNRMVCSFMPIVGKNSGYGGDCPGEHPNDSGRTQSRTQPSKPRHCLIGETCGRQPKGKEIPSRACATPERCALVCARSEARSIIDVSKAKKEHSREAVEGRRGLMRVRELLVPVAGHLSRARLIMCHLSSCCAGRSRGVAARRRILSARWQPTRGMFLGSR